MMYLRGLSIALVAAICLGQAVAAEAPREGPVLWLSGPFGRIPADAQLAASLSSDQRSLDAWVQGAPLALDTGASRAMLRSWTVTAADPTSTTATELARGSSSSGDLTGVAFAGPEDPGSYRLGARAVTAAGETLTGTWQIEVPAQPFPQDGVLDIPAPAALLESAGGDATGWAGHGCYVFLCVEIGQLPPAQTLEEIDVVAGDAMELRLSDGSGFTLGEVSFTALVGDDDDWTGTALTRPRGPVQRVAITAPPSGEWLLSLEILYDRERGFSETTFRLLSKQAGD